MRDAWGPTAREKNMDVAGSSCMILKDGKVFKITVK